MSATRPLVVVPGDDPPLLGGSPQLERLRERTDVVLYDSRPRDDEEKVRRARDAEILMNTRGTVRWPARVLRQLPSLKMICCCAVGYDCIDLAAARKQNVIVCNVPGRTAPFVAEHAIALLLGAARRLAWLTAEIKQGHWPGKHLVSLVNKRLGVLGTGNIGCETVRRARALGMDVVAWSFHPSPDKAARFGFRYVDRDELLETSDAITVHLRLTEQSRAILDAEAFAKMKPGALLVNTARGGIIDHTALVDALQSGRLGGAALDVFETEPLAADDPLLECEQVVLTPHAADLMPEAIEALCAGAVDNVFALLDGQPQNVVS